MGLVLVIKLYKKIGLDGELFIPRELSSEPKNLEKLNCYCHQTP
jgi:hypothetical protein